jgi:hypothetical protein
MSGCTDGARSPGIWRHRSSVLVAGEMREAGTEVDDLAVQAEDPAAATTMMHTATARITSPPLRGARVRTRRLLGVRPLAHHGTVAIACDEPAARCVPLTPGVSLSAGTDTLSTL